MGIFDKAKDLASKHPDQVDQVIERVGDEVDARTGNKHQDKVDRAQQAAKDKLNPNP
ncbi:antitoxin [Enemella sp. A6]|uniref:antitoxin n=1 Tax=Enemella sp. A6 TaxID=3440152 RepID=UPI003EB6A9D9